MNLYCTSIFNQKKISYIVKPNVLMIFQNLFYQSFSTKIYHPFQNISMKSVFYLSYQILFLISSIFQKKKKKKKQCKSKNRSKNTHVNSRYIYEMQQVKIQLSQDTIYSNCPRFTSDLRTIFRREIPAFHFLVRASTGRYRCTWPADRHCAPVPSTRQRVPVSPLGVSICSGSRMYTLALKCDVIDSLTRKRDKL